MTGYSRETECRFKNGYRTHAAARRAARRNQSLPRDQKRKLGPLQQYRCSYCGLWHNGHAPGTPLR